MWEGKELLHDQHSCAGGAGLQPVSLGGWVAQMATELTGALKYFKAIVAISGYLWHCPIHTCNGQTLLLCFGSFKYVATISFALTYRSSSD